MIGRTHGQGYAEYVSGGSWKCSSSPTGAHHWIVGRTTVCKHCHLGKAPEGSTEVRPGNQANPKTDVGS